MRKFSFLLPFLAMLLSLSARTQTTYTYNGANGYWHDGGWAPAAPPVNANGEILPANIVIQGNCTYWGPARFLPGTNLTVKAGASLSFNGSAPPNNAELYFAGSKFTVEPGGTLNTGGCWMFENGKMEINGTFFCGYMFGQQGTSDSITVSGVFNDYAPICVINGPMLVKSGGILKVYANAILALHSPAKLTVQSGGTLTNLGSIKGTGTYEIASFSNEGTLAPGNSPGTISVNGNYAPASSAMHSFEVAGTSAGQYDQLNVSGMVNLNGALNVTLINGFIPSGIHDLPIITGANITGTFSSVNIPPSSGYTLVYTPTSVLLRKSAVLPVSFVSLQAQSAGGGLNLVWKVAGEQGVARYDVEQSTNGTVYQVVGSKVAAGLSQYTLRLPIPSAKSFYRVRAVDVDNQVKYSPIATFLNGRSLIALQVHPNPATNTIRVQFESAGKNALVRVTNTSGHSLLTQTLPRGSQQTALDISQLAKGVYTLQYISDGRTESLLFFKL